MPDYAALADKKAELIRKGLEGSVFAAPFSATLLTQANLFGVGGVLTALPAGHSDLGHTTEDGAKYQRSITSSDITSWGSNEPTRSDIKSDTTTMAVVAQETKLLTLSMFTGADIDPGDRDAANGSLEIRQASATTPRYYRLLSMAVDLSEDGEIYLARYMPKAKITDRGEQALDASDGGLVYPLTFTGYKDSTAGFANSFLFGGPGWLALLEDMGFDPLAP